MICFDLRQISCQLYRSLIIFIGVTASLANPASSETGVKNMLKSYLRGEVIAVDDNLVLHLKITENVNFDHSPIDKIKIFRLDITPDALRWLTLGRKVHCTWRYSKESYSVGDCWLMDITNDHKGLPKPLGQIDNLVRSLGLGVLKCSQEDMDGLKKATSEDYMKGLCRP